MAEDDKADKPASKKANGASSRDVEADAKKESEEEAKADARDPSDDEEAEKDKPKSSRSSGAARVPSSPWPSAHKAEPKKEAEPAKEKGAPTGDKKDSGVPHKAAWGAPFAKLDRGWTTLESRLCAAVLVGEVLTLVFWISIKALSATGRAGPGMIFRALVTALILGAIAHKASKKHERHEVITTGAALLGLALGTRWGDTGTTYFANLFAWLQNSSILVFFGGVSELARRMTLWLALLGASLATAQGKHINVDVAMRFLSPRARVPVAVLGWVAAAIVSISAAWGFFDYVAVEEMRAPPTIPCADDQAKRCPAPPGSKIDKVLASSGRNFFLAGRQLSLDLRSFPKVISGTPYNKWMTPKEWNEWLRGGGWESHFKPEDVKAFELPDDGSIDFRNPSVTAIPGGTEAVPKILVPLFNLVFAFGLLVIGVRFLLRSVLAISGWVKVDPAAAHGDDELAHIHDHSPEAELAEAAIKETHT